MNAMRRSSGWMLAGFLAGTMSLAGAEDAEKPKRVSGKADVLRHVKKQFATFLGSGDAEVRLRLEGDEADSTWPLQDDAEIRVCGWWGRLEQLEPGHRVWAWFAVDRRKEPSRILLLADELSEQDIHGQPWTVDAVEGGAVTFSIPGEKKVEPRTLRMKDPAMEAGARGYLQSAGDDLVRFLAIEEFAAARAEQREWLRKRWREEGLPGMVSFLHPMSGEMEVFLDHEAMRWGRFLETGAEVTFEAGETVEALVKFVEPWREKTRLRLVSNRGLDQSLLVPGQRIRLRVPEPPEEIRSSDRPTDIGRLEDADERIDWFLASTYCPCGISGDRCTGMYYTLASCNVNTCGAPDDAREVLAKLIGEGLTDVEIFDRLREQKGRDFWQPHLLR